MNNPNPNNPFDMNGHAWRNVARRTKRQAGPCTGAHFSTAIGKVGHTGSDDLSRNASLSLPNPHAPLDVLRAIVHVASMTSLDPKSIVAWSERRASVALAANDGNWPTAAKGITELIDIERDITRDLIQAMSKANTSAERSGVQADAALARAAFISKTH